MKRKMSILILIALVALILALIFYILFSDKITGNFFRKNYGTVCSGKDNELVINYELFSFNEKPSFLDELYNLEFENENIRIKKIDYMLVNETKDLRIYDVSFTLIDDVDPVFYLTNLKVKSENGDQIYPMGNLCVVNKGLYLNPPVSIGFAPMILDEVVYYYFTESNTRWFCIEDMILPNDEYISYDYDKNIIYEPGSEEQVLCVRFKRNLNYGDRTIFQPVFIARFEDEIEPVLFIPFAKIYDDISMSYKEVKEYIK